MKNRGFRTKNCGFDEFFGLFAPGHPLPDTSLHPISAGSTPRIEPTSQEQVPCYPRLEVEVFPRARLPVTLLLVIARWIFFAGKTLGPAKILVGTKRYEGGWSLKKREMAHLEVEGSDIIFDVKHSRMFSEVARYLEADTDSTDTMAGLPSPAIFNVFTQRRAPMKSVYMWPGHYSSDEV